MKTQTRVNGEEENSDKGIRDMTAWTHGAQSPRPTICGSKDWNTQTKKILVMMQEKIP